MGCPSQCVLGEKLTFTVQLAAATGSPVNADGSVSYSIYEDETATAILTGTMTRLAAQTGFYSEQISCTVANGFERYKSYTARISAAIEGVSVAKAYTFLCLGVEDAGTGTTGALTTTANVKSYLGITVTDYDSLFDALISRSTAAIENYCNRSLLSDTYREVYNGDGSTVLYLREWPVTDISLLAISTYDAICIKNTSTDAYAATFSVSLDDTDLSVSEAVTLTISGGTNAGTDSLTLADYTLSTLATAIAALGKGWSASVVSSGWNNWAATELLPVFGQFCLDEWAYATVPYEGINNFNIIGETQSPYRANVGEINYSEGLPDGKSNIIVRYTAGYGTIPADLEQTCIDVVKSYYDLTKHNSFVKSESLGAHSITYTDKASNIFLKDSLVLSADVRRRLTSYKRLRI